jgi:hypothetical protein
MLSIKEPRVMWAWICPITGMVWDEGWGSTEAYATSQTARTFGKRRMTMGDMRMVKVTIEPLSPEEEARERAAFAEWKAAKAANAGRAAPEGDTNG